MSNPEIGGNAHTDQHRPSPAQIAAFAVAIRAAFGDAVDETHDPTTGYRWTWANRGVWTLQVGGILTTEPVLHGPAGTWRLETPAIGEADLVLLMLRLAGGLPDGVSPRRVSAGGVYGSAPLPRRLPAPALMPVPATPIGRPAPGRVLDVALPPIGDPHDGRQRVRLPSGQTGIVDLRQECRLVDHAPDTGAMTVIVVAVPRQDRNPADPIPATLYEAAAGGPFDRHAPQVAAVEPSVLCEMRPPAPAGLEWPARGAGVTETWKAPAPAA